MSGDLEAARGEPRMTPEWFRLLPNAVDEGGGIRDVSQL